MRKLWVLSLKEARITFRDIGAILTMLVTPLALTLAIAAAFGAGGDDPISEIPVLLIDYDQSIFSQILVDLFNSEQVGDLVALEIVGDENLARERLEGDEAATLVIIPAGFSERIFPLGAIVEERLGIDLLAIPAGGELSLEQQAQIRTVYIELQEEKAADPSGPIEIEIYASPDWQISASVVKSIVSQGLEAIHLQVQGATGIMARLGSADDWDGEIGPASQQAGIPFADSELGSELPIKLMIVTTSGKSFSWLDYTAVSMAILFLMFAVTAGGRTLLAEREAGTLPRLLVTPTPALTVLLGKMGGVVLIGLLQVFLLWGATSLIGAYWGPAPAVIISIICLVFCAASIGAVISAWAKTPGQASAIGMTVTLVGGALSGTYFPRDGLPEWVQTISLLTPNAWGIEIFSRLQAGQILWDVLPQLGGVLLLTLVYYSVSMLGFRRQFE